MLAFIFFLAFSRIAKASSANISLRTPFSPIKTILVCAPIGRPIIGFLANASFTFSKSFTLVLIAATGKESCTTEFSSFPKS